MFAARNPPQEAICDTCTDERKRARVGLLQENEVAAKIFLMTRSQCEVRWDGEKDVEIDLHHPSLWKAIKKFPGGIQDEWGTFNRVLRAWHTSQQLKRDSEG
jgi:hypothetical protein